MGLTRRVREGLGYNDVVDQNSTAYAVGQVAGTAINIGLSFANPCAMIGAMQWAYRGLQAVQAVGGYLNYRENVAAGNYGSATLDALGIFGNVAQMLRACFRAGEPVLLDLSGKAKPIEEIQEGDFVLSGSEFDPTGPLEPKRVEEKFVRLAEVMEVVVRGRVIGTTGEHPFYVFEKGWIAANELKPGDQFRSHDGQWVAVEATRHTGKLETVYNFRVADWHTYFVGSSEWGFSVWAHNAYFGPKNSSEVVPVAGLAGHEGATLGHTILKHIGKTVAELRNRLLSEPWISGASSFYNRRIAELAISRSIATKSVEITAWLAAGGAKPFRATVDLGNNIGRSLASATGSSDHAKKVFFMLRPDSKSPLGYYILTAYPKV